MDDYYSGRRVLKIALWSGAVVVIILYFLLVVPVKTERFSGRIVGAPTSHSWSLLSLISSLPSSRGRARPEPEQTFVCRAKLADGSQVQVFCRENQSHGSTESAVKIIHLKRLVPLFSTYHVVEH
ncbi:hypothetical protein ACMC9M_15885 [Pseudomonadota bacterium 24LQ007]